MDASAPIRVRKGTVRVTREGWYWLLAAVVLLIVGWFKAINLLLFLGYAMVILWVGGLVLVLLRLRRLRLRRRVAEPIFARTPFTWSSRSKTSAPAPRPGCGSKIVGRGIM
jgi:hypothetical protein